MGSLLLAPNLESQFTIFHAPTFPWVFHGNLPSKLDGQTRHICWDCLNLGSWLRIWTPGCGWFWHPVLIFPGTCGRLITQDDPGIESDNKIWIPGLLVWVWASVFMAWNLRLILLPLHGFFLKEKKKTLLCSFYGIFRGLEQPELAFYTV